MASTIKTWKETFIHKYKESGFNYFGWFDDKYEILIKKKLSDDHETIWFTAYVKLDEPLKESYQFESYRNKNIIGIDSSDLTSWTAEYQKTILKVRIKSIINEHHGK